MTGYNLPKNYIDNLEALLRKNRSRITSSSATPPVVELVTPTPYATTAMAKTLHDYPPPLLPTCPLGPLSTRELETLSYALA